VSELLNSGRIAVKSGRFKRVKTTNVTMKDVEFWEDNYHTLMEEAYINQYYIKPLVTTRSILRRAFNCMEMAMTMRQILIKDKYCE
jgi:hypothetical protein